MTGAKGNSGTRVFGLGSPHGDDQAGWIIARQLVARGFDQAMVLRNPAELLDELADCHHAIIVDACESHQANPVGNVAHFHWPDPRLQSVNTFSTHGFDLKQSLNLAASIGRLPPVVEIYTVSVAAPECGAANVVDAVSVKVLTAVGEVIERIDSQLRGSKET